MDPECYHCGESYSLRDSQEPTTFCDACAHDIAEAALTFAIAYDADEKSAGHAMLAVVRAARSAAIDAQQS